MHPFLEAVLTSAPFVATALVWLRTSVNPLLQIARACVLMHCALIVLGRSVQSVARAFQPETMRMYRWLRVREGV